jgi:hypothetical protein
VLTRQKAGLEQLIKDAGFKGVHIVEDGIAMRFTTFEDWWEYGRGSTWGDLLLDHMTPEQVAEFKKKHEAEVKSLFGPEGIKTTTPVLFALAKKPE